MSKSNTRESSLEAAKKRLKEKAKEFKKKNTVPPKDDDEPTGRLSGGPEHLDLEDDDSEE